MEKDTETQIPLPFDIAPNPDGIVIYSDGGARPNPGFMGWGFHGYVYNADKPKKGTGNTTHYPSPFGYVPKASKDKVPEVTPLTYIDGYGCTGIKGSNNLAELRATNAAIAKAVDFKPKKLLIRTDSEYVRRGIVEWSNSWIRNNWVRADGTQVPNAEHWKSILANLETLRESGGKFKVEWVKGHSDVFGNTLADKLATVGVMSSISGGDRTHTTFKQPEGYWKHEVKKHPFISHKTLYFNTLRHSQKPGYYYLGEHGKDDDMIGKKMSDGAYAVIHLETPDPIVELVRTQQTKLSGNYDAIVMVKLDNLFKPSIYDYIENYGEDAMVRPNPTRLDMTSLDKEPITRELRPPKLASRAIESLSLIELILEKYKTNNLEDFKLVDITDIFFSKKEVVKKKETTIECTMKPLSLGVAAVPITIKIEDKDQALILTLGIDLPSRNSIKGMEDKDIKMNLVYWRESDKCIRYAIIIENGRDYGIWAGFYSNFILLNK